jgi:hypothetical protein
VSNNRLVFDGLAELREQLRSLPADMTGEASNIIDATANGAAVEIRTAYGGHRVTGRLQDGVVVTHVDKGKYSAGAIVKNTAKHAGIFENGTQARHTDLGANRGSMPPGHVFVPIVIRKRREMYGKLQAMLERMGLTVSGSE